MYLTPEIAFSVIKGDDEMSKDANFNHLKLEDEQDKLISLLDDYYGNSRDIDHKEEIASFIINYYEDIKVIMEMTDKNR